MIKSKVIKKNKKNSSKNFKLKKFFFGREFGLK